MNYKMMDEIFLKWIRLSGGLTTAQVADHSYKYDIPSLSKVRRTLRRLEKDGLIKSRKGAEIHFMCNPNEIYWEPAE